jgi:hypothetical protein
VASERRHVTRCWAGLARQTQAKPSPPASSDGRRLRPNTAGSKPRAFAYTSADLARESGSSTLAGFARSARTHSIDLSNPYQVTGLVAWSRRKELAHAGIDVATMLTGLAVLDEHSSAGWPLSTRVRPAKSPLRQLAERAGRSTRVSTPRPKDDDLYLPRPRFPGGRP